jgi:hypothetical protein
MKVNKWLVAAVGGALLIWWWRRTPYAGQVFMAWSGNAFANLPVVMSPQVGVGTRNPTAVPGPPGIPAANIFGDPGTFFGWRAVDVAKRG